MDFDFYPLTLDALPKGEKGRVIAVRGGRGLVMRLSHLGILPGAVVRAVAQAPLHGPLLVEVNGAQVALGRGVARRVLVQPIESKE